MDFGTAIATCFRKYATFSGRAARSEFWWFVLFGLIVGIVAMIIDTMLLGYERDEEAPFNLITNVLFFLPGMAVAVRRFHDRDTSAWWMAPIWAFTALDIITRLAGLKIIDEINKPIFTMFALMGLLCFGAYLVICIVQFCTRGTIGPNQYGDDPLPAPALVDTVSSPP